MHRKQALILAGCGALSYPQAGAPGTGCYRWRVTKARESYRQANSPRWRRADIDFTRRATPVKIRAHHWYNTRRWF